MKNYILKLFLTACFIMASATSWAQYQTKPNLAYQINGNQLTATDNTACFNLTDFTIYSQCIKQEPCKVQIYKHYNPMTNSLNIEFRAIESNQIVFQRTINVQKYKKYTTNFNTIFQVFEQSNSANEQEYIGIALDKDEKTITQILYQLVNYSSKNIYIYVYSCVIN